jgi:hypothetical protein
LPAAAIADDTAEDLKQLQAAIQKELAALKKREQKLHQEFLRLDQKSQLLDEQMCRDVGLNCARVAATRAPVFRSLIEPTIFPAPKPAPVGSDNQFAIVNAKFPV